MLVKGVFGQMSKLWGGDAQDSVNKELRILLIDLFRSSSGMHHGDLQAELQKYTIITAGNH